MYKDTASENDMKDIILREQVRLAMDQLPAMQTSSLIVALVISFAVRGNVPYTHILVWLLLVSVIATGRIALHYRFVKARHELFAAGYWRNAYLLLAFISGIIWGLSAYLIFPADNNWLISLLVLVIASLSAATTISHSSIRLAPAIWAGPALMFYSVRCFTGENEPERILGFLIVLYLVTIIRYSFKHSKAITSSIALKFENLQLLGELKQHAAVQEILLEEVNHRVKNNLAQILSMIHLEQDKLGDKETRMVLPFLHTLEGRIDGLATVHSLLSANKWQTIQLSDLCEEIISAVTRTLGFSSKVKLHVTPSDRMLNTDQAHFLTIVLNELAMNSLKHASRDKEELHIDVEIKSSRDGTSLTYRDDGPGYPEALLISDTNHRHGGLALLTGIVQHSLKGNLEIENDEGAVTVITF